MIAHSSRVASPFAPYCIPRSRFGPSIWAPAQPLAQPPEVVAMDSRLHARIGAARLVLQEAAGAPHFASVSRSQTAALLELLQNAALPAESLADVSAAVMRLPLAAADLSAVLSAIAPASLPTGVRRRRLQCYEAILQYCTEQHWAALLSKSTPAAAKLELIMGRLVALGCRCPSETTLKLCASWWLVVAEPEHSLLQLTGPAKVGMLQAAKKEFQRAARGAPEAPTHLGCLPTSPAELLKSWPVIFNAAFGESVPVQPDRSVETRIIEFNRTYGCRGSRGSMSVVPIAAGPAEGAQMPLERLTAMFMEQQQRFMETCLGRGPATPVRRAPTIRFYDDEPLAVPEAFRGDLRSRTACGRRVGG